MRCLFIFLFSIALVFTSEQTNASAADELRVNVPLQKLSQPKRTCYTQAEAEAEQGLRIHSELMVIGLNCQHMTPRGWTNFYAQYRDITNRHSDLLAGYERTLINYYQQAGRRNPERSLHDLRTDLANKVSKDAARMRPDVFCANFAPRLPKVAKMSRGAFRNWAATSPNSSSTPMCR